MFTFFVFNNTLPFEDDLKHYVKESNSQNTTCLEIDSTIETTCFGLYWPSSGFYKIEESSIKALTTVRGC
jgi:hypothetical protein